jgi:tetratricopeptide (TPR) repeat protein
MGLRRLGYLPLLLGLSLLGCAGIGSRATLDPPAERGAHGRIDSVPFFAQAEHQCGPAALAMALSWSGVAVKPEELLATVYSPARQGSLQYALIAAARRHGRLAYPITGIDPLLTETAAGHPVIVLQNLGLSWFPRWHYAVVVGYDLPAREIILHTGKTPYQPLPLRTFKNTWARSGYWGLLVLPPDALPAEAEEEAHLAAVLGLEKAGQWDAAATGYQTVLRRWPGNLTALIGLGNSYHAQGRLADAESVFRRAATLHPGSGTPLNNLAQVLWEQGRADEALAAAKRAVSLGGPLQDMYRQTLEEIQAAHREK